MKKKFIVGIALLAIVGVVICNVKLGSQTNGMSSIMLANIEALADDEYYDGGELPEVVISCSSTPCVIPYSGSLGQCWDNSCNFWQELLGGVRCKFTGSMSDFCYYIL